MSQSEKTSLYSTIDKTEGENYDYGRPNYSSIRLMELPQPLLELIDSANPSRMTIKASSNGTAILNTPTKSFLLREVDQSNSLMLFSPSETDGFHLVHTAKKYLEVVSNPYRIKLDQIIPELDSERVAIDRKGITMEDVRRRLAASDFEIDTALRSAMAVEIEGFVYRMTPAYVTQILHFIITAATADSLPLDALTLVSILTSFGDEERPECIQTILRTFSKSPTEPYSLDHSKIIQWYGIRTLADINHKMPTALFMERWQSVIPAAIDKATPSTTLLKGNCYHPTPTTIHYLPASELSTVPEQRFGQLFGIKEKWSMDEIMPFLEGCVESGEGWEKKAERECQKWARVRQGLVMKR